MSSGVAMQVEGLRKSYGSVVAVDDLSFDVRDGEIFGILGPNGAGKTTTLECSLGTRRPSAGRVSLLGRDPVAERRRLFACVGVQFQDSAWQPGIRVGELCEATACLYTPVPEWRELLSEFDLEKRLHAAVESLSGGEKQKLSILLACMHSPDLIFLDELTTGLDPLARRETWRFIERLRGRGATVVLTSHFMDEVERLCDRGMVLRNGRKVAEGTIGEIRAQGGGFTLEDSYIRLAGGEK
ncbi:MAG: ABC transporter ATP-binding protein [Spirochaetota bacterium]